MIFDIREGIYPLGCDATGEWIRCHAIDVKTGERVPSTFYYDTESHRVGRHTLNEKGLPFFDRATRRAAETWETRELRFEPVGEDFDPPIVFFVDKAS